MIINDEMDELSDAAAKPPPPPLTMPYKDEKKRYERQQKFLKMRRASAINLFGGKCVKCSSKDRVEFDHIDPKTKISHKFWSWALPRLLAELAKCQLLCRTCHENKSAKERYGVEPRSHGSARTYEYHGCRCDACRFAHAERARYYRDLKNKKLGIVKRKYDSSKRRAASLNGAALGKEEKV